jgi:hypothetical protein
VSHRTQASIGLCDRCGVSVEQRGRTVWRCPECGEEWDLEWKPDRWRAASEFDIDLGDDGGDEPEWAMPDGHSSPSDGDKTPLIFALVSGLGFGGACIGAVLSALTSPTVAVLLVGGTIGATGGLVAALRRWSA